MTLSKINLTYMYTIAQYFPENVLIDNAMAVILVVLVMPCAWKNM
jgi:hypothetical protein